jgi:hypothetical protein
MIERESGYFFKKSNQKFYFLRPLSGQSMAAQRPVDIKGFCGAFFQKSDRFPYPSRCMWWRWWRPRCRAKITTKDIDFSGAGIRTRWEAGYARTRAAIELAPWTAPADPLEGVILHRVDAA